MSIDIESLRSSIKANNKYTLRVWIQPLPDTPSSVRHVDDTIYVVKRGFFDLD